MNRKYRYLDLFAGVGGITYSLYPDHECIGVSEIDKYALLTYKVNHPNIKDEMYLGDIKSIQDLNTDIDILLGGVPCTSFSVAGKRLGTKDPIVGDLFEETIRVVRINRPKVVFIENVKGLLSHNQGNTFKDIEKKLKDLDYTVHYQVLKAEEYGMVQTRHRIYIVCFDNKVFKDTSFEFPVPTNVTTELRSILEVGVNPKYILTDTMWSYLKARKQEQKDKGNGFGYKMYTRSSPSVGTLSARYGKDGSEILINEEWLLSNPNPRRLTPRECARLQGFPDSFNISACSDTQLYKQFGNSVCVPVVSSIIKNILDKLDEL